MGLARAGLVRSVDAVLGSRSLTGPYRSLTKGRLRVLGYHGVSDPAVFESQMRHLVDDYQPIGPREVAAAFNGEPVPDRSVWVTFDDADPTVIDNALPILRALAIPATLFLCPGVVGTVSPYWWQIVADYEADPEAGTIRNRPPEGWLAFLKSTKDAERREIVSEMADSLTRSNASPPTRRQITVEELQEFAAHGTLGNHTWDHPCLDMCPEEEQSLQIAEAHDWLRSNLGFEATLFAYPNGNHSHAAQRVLEELGYDIAVMFDHHLAHTGQDPLRLSRIRTSDVASPARYSALVSGVHSVVHRGRTLIRYRH